MLERFLKEKTNELQENNYASVAIGRLTDLPPGPLEQLHKTIEATRENNGLNLILASSYGAREEIIDGIKSVMSHINKGHLDPAMLTQKYSASTLHPLLSRSRLINCTSGECVFQLFAWQISC